MNGRSFKFWWWNILTLWLTLIPSCSTIPSNSFNPRELNLLINELGQYWNMSSLYIVYNSKATNTEFIRDILEDLHQNGSYFQELPQLIVDDGHIVQRFSEDKYFNSNSLVLTLMHHINDDVLEATVNATRRRRMCFSIFLVRLFTHEVEYQRFFETLWKYQMRRPLLIVNGGQLLTMDPYPNLQVVNVSGEHVSQMYPQAQGIRNFKGYTIDIPVQTNLPYTFWYWFEKSHEYRVDGLSGYSIHLLLKRLNITMNVFPYYAEESNFLNLEKINELLLSGQIELSPHLVSIFKQKDLDYSYPYIMTSRCVMMPMPQKHSDKFVVIHWSFWILLAIVVVLQEIIVLMLVRLSRQQKKENSIVLLNHQQRLLMLLSTILAIPMPPLRLPSWRQVSLYVFVRLICIFFLINMGGLYISNIFSTELTSRVTSAYFKTSSPQLEDMLASNVPLMLHNSESQAVLELFHKLHPQWNGFVNASSEEIHSNRRNLNPAFMYLVSTEEFDIIDEQQHYLQERQRFVLLDICHGSYPFQMQLRADSHLTELLHMHILHVRETGLYNYLKKYLFHRAKIFGKMDYIRDGNRKRPEANELDSSFQLNPLRPMLLVLSVGYTCSIIAFMCELYGERIVRKIRRAG